MILPLNINRRHKVTLFLAVLLAGIAALNGAKMMEVVGILLLGLALAWAFGSDSRVVHWLFLSLGVLLACGTVGLARYINQTDANLYAEKVAAFGQRIPELANEYPLHKNGQIILDKDLEPYLKNPKAGMSSPQVMWDEPSKSKHPPKSAPSSTLPALDPATAKPLAVTMPDGHVQPVTALTMPDGHFRYFAFERDAERCQEGFFTWGKTQEMWNEAWVAGLDLSEVDFLKLPGDPPKTRTDDWWVYFCLGVFLFALGLGLIIGIRAKPLPT